MYNQQQHLPTITPDMIRSMPDQTCDILNRLIRFYEQYRDISYYEIQKNSKTITIANDVVNGIQTDITNIHSDINEIQGDISDIQGDITSIEGDIDTMQQDISDLQGGLGGLATVARTGSYNDLSNKPTIPVITMTTNDPGEGASLAANHYIAVYT